MIENMTASERLTLIAELRATMGDEIFLGRARGDIVHMRPKDWVKDSITGLLVPDYRWRATERGPEIDRDSAEVLHEETSWNVKTTAGIDFLFQQGYKDSGLASNGLNYVALSNDTVSETSASTTLSNEIAVNGLSRAQGTYAHTNGQSTATVAKTFTCATSSQAAQKGALFALSSGGTMNHVLAFTQRTLQVGDTLAVTFTITLS